MIKHTLINDYIFDEQAKIWSKSNYEDIKYSDGAEVEQRLLNIVTNASDLSVLSLELRGHCTDWPSLYHLSSSRANLLRPFESQLAGADVLEIGAGCGAITRFLGECGAQVLALEGTKIRAAIARSRTRDLNNVELVVDSFKDFNLDKKFDFITFIGVLEYSNLFMDGEQPAKSLLEHASRFLRPGGKIIIAIENQLGLKYFAGAPEDHLGIPMYGIEGRYLNNQAQTFGRFELEKMLKDVGMRKIQFFSPLPDYKLPCSIVSEEGFKNDDFDSAALAWQSVHKDPQLPEKATFCLEFAWPTVVNNKLGLELANSFLILASDDNINTDPNNTTLAWHYSTSRRSEYCKETRFYTDASGIQVGSRLLKPGSKPHKESYLVHSLVEKTEYVQGQVLHFKFLEVIAKEGLNIPSMVCFFAKYLSVLQAIFKRDGLDFQSLAPEVIIPGRYFDCLPHNIIEGEPDPLFIDQEWEAKHNLELGFLVFRAILLSVHQLPHFSSRDINQITNRKDLIMEIFSGLGWQIYDEKFYFYVKLHLVNQEEFSGKSERLEDFQGWLNTSPVYVRPNLFLSCFEQDLKIVQLVEQANVFSVEIAAQRAMISDAETNIDQLKSNVLEKESNIQKLLEQLNESQRSLDKMRYEATISRNVIADLSSRIKDVDEEIARLQEIVALKEEYLSSREILVQELRGALHAVLSSRSWRMTKPLRLGIYWLRRLVRIPKNITSVAVGQ